MTQGMELCVGPDHDVKLIRSASCVIGGQADSTLRNIEYHALAFVRKTALVFSFESSKPTSATFLSFVACSES